MAKLESFFIFAVILLITFSSAGFAGTYSGGTGEPNNPYLIATAEDLNDIGNHPEDFDKHFLMVADINLADYTGTQFNIIAPDTDNGQPLFQGTPFTGTFDGNGHIVSNFTYTSTGTDYIALFGYVASPGEIKNLGMVDVNVDAGTGYYVGGLVGLNDFGIVSNCYATATVTGNKYVGGLVGLNYYDGTVSNCYATSTVSGVSWVGGLVGINHFGTVSICYAAGNVSGSGSVGGLVGYNNYGTVSKCYATGTVSGVAYVGGLVGYNNYGTVSKCYATGTVSGVAYVGGLVGYRYYGTVSNCYASGSVSGGYWYVGGLVGWNNSTVSNCYATGSVSGSSIVGGLVGYDYFGTVTASFWDIDTSGQLTSAGGVGKTTAEMKTRSTFTSAGWDFIEVWDIGENQTYPFLRTHPAADIDHDNIVNFYDLAILADHWLQNTP